MELTEGRWFIDAWAVFDGIAFASLRTDDGPPEEIVSLHPPYWTPVPVMSLALAGGAARRGFQEGFLDADGDEIAFDDLEQVVEMVRRGYLSGGIDPGTEPALRPTRAPEAGLESAAGMVDWFLEMYDHKPEALDSVFTEILHAHGKGIWNWWWALFELSLSAPAHAHDVARTTMLTAWLRYFGAIPLFADYREHLFQRGFPVSDGPLPDRFLWNVGLPAPIGRRITTVGDVIMATGCSVEFVRRALSSNVTSFLFAHSVYAVLSLPPGVVGTNPTFDAALVSSILSILPRRVDRKHEASRAMEKLVARLMNEGGRAVRRAMREDDEPRMRAV